MWERRCHLDLSSQKSQEEELALRQKTIDELEKRRNELCNHDGASTAALLRQSVDYLENKAKRKAGMTNGSKGDQDGEAGDRLHLEQRREAVASLTSILSALDLESARLSESISSQLTDLGEARRSMLREQDQVFEGDEWKTMPYRLRAVLATKASGMASSDVVFFRAGPSGGWWKSEGQEEVVSVEESEVLASTSSDENDGTAISSSAVAPSAIPYYLLYNVASEDEDTDEQEEEKYVPPLLREAVEQDNEVLDGMLLSLGAGDTEGIDADGDATMAADAEAERGISSSKPADESKPSVVPAREEIKQSAET